MPTFFPEAGLRVFRHRYFETNNESLRRDCALPHAGIHGRHRVRDPKNARMGIDGDFFSVAGNGGGVWGTTDEWFSAMGYGTLGYDRGSMTKRGLCESIPPQYSFFIASKNLWSRSQSDFSNKQ